MKYMSVFGMLLACSLVVPAMAQIPVPPQTEQGKTGVTVPAPSSAVVPDFDAAPRKQGQKQAYTDADGVSYYADGTMKLSPKAMAATQKLQQENRDYEAGIGGFSWMPWARAGAKVWEFIGERDATMRENIDLRDGEFFDIAVYDLDRDGKPDIILWDWGSCGQEGCLFTVFFDNKLKNQANYVGRTLRPYKLGVMVDNGYYGM